MKKITREEFDKLFEHGWFNENRTELWNHINALQSELEALEGRKGMAEIDRGGHALNEAGWAFIESWKKMGLGQMSGDTWNNCKQGIVYPVVKAYLDNLNPLPPKVPRERTNKEMLDAMVEHHYHESGLEDSGALENIALELASGKSLKDLCTAAGIPTTTEEV